jgi:serine/threonine protein kinase
MLSMKKPESSEDRLIGRSFGDYRLQRLMATGGMARIYSAIDTKLGRTVAVKLLSVEGNPDTTLAHRFQREARAIARLDHKNIITIYHYGETGGFCYIAMRMIDGRDLSAEIARLRRGGHKMEVGRALYLLEQIAAALDYAHQHSIVHRDVKPSNILIDKQDHAVLTDFGLLLQSTDDATKTQGTAFGTPRYIAPEQALDSAKAVSQTDIYALAVILYEILTGEAPFHGETPMEIALGHIGEPPRPPRSINPKIAIGAERELLRALEKDPYARHKTATEFIQAVRAAYSVEQPDSLKYTPPPPPAPQIVKLDEPIAQPASSTPLLESWDNDGSTDVIDSAQRPVTPHKNRRKIAPVFIILALLALGLVALLLSGALRDNRVVMLQYDTNTFFIHNGYQESLDVFSLQFIRGTDGEGNDDYSGDRIDDNVIPASECYLLRLFAFDVALPSSCSALHNYEELQDPRRFFWRREPVDAAFFAVVYDRQPVATCPTVREGESQTCSFALPAATQSG